MSIAERVAGLRNEMARLSWDAYVVWGTDPHESEYVGERWQTRGWLSGFSGSAGTLAVTATEAKLWTDGRYFLQAEAQLAGSPFELFREGQPATPTVWSWLKQVLKPGSVVGVAAETTNWDRYRRAQDELALVDIKIEAGPDPLDALWLDRPTAPASPVWDYQQRVAVESRQIKLERVRKTFDLLGIEAFLVTALDEIAWLFNLRGADVQFTPVFLAYALVDRERAWLFCDPDRLTEQAPQNLMAAGVELLPYAEIQTALASWPTKRRLGLSADKTNLALMAGLEKADHPAIVPLASPIAGLKAVKTPTELELIRCAHLKDGKALAEFLAWFEKAVPEGGLSELASAQKLDQFRQEQPGWQGPSFEPIPGYREHGAIVHYKVTEANGSQLAGSGLFLLDTGAQYLEGTTDVTRTLLVGLPDPAWVEDYTLVLKAHVQVALSPFPRGTRGYQIDAIARRPLWQHLRQFQHGTGHGVGHFLAVHEGPQRLNSEPLPTVLEPGMVLSNEPGIYRSGRWGVRIENLVVVRPGPSNEFADFLEWETLTLCPYERRLIDTNLLDADERSWIDAYHQRVFDLVAPWVSAQAREWLAQATLPLTN